MVVIHVKTRLKSSFSLIDLTPLVDVVFLMLIFFIITSDILPLKSLNIENPTLNTTSAPLTSQLLVVIDAQNVIYVGERIKLNSSMAQLQQKSIANYLTQELMRTKSKSIGMNVNRVKAGYIHGIGDFDISLLAVVSISIGFQLR